MTCVTRPMSRLVPRLWINAHRCGGGVTREGYIPRRGIPRRHGPRRAGPTLKYPFLGSLSFTGKNPARLNGGPHTRPGRRTSAREPTPPHLRTARTFASG